MSDWIIEEIGWQEEKITANGNKYLIGNGYMGVRGTMDEAEKEQFPAVNLAGTYDQAGEFYREPLNAPNGLFTYVKTDEALRLPEKEPCEHKICLNYRHGIFLRKTIFQAEAGRVTLTSERFASMESKHLLALKYCIECDYSGELTILTGIDGDVWDLNGPHYDSIHFFHGESGDTDYLEAAAITHENQDTVYVLETIDMSGSFFQTTEIKDRRILRSIRLHVEPKKQYILHKYVSVYTSKDTIQYIDCAKRDLKMARQKHYEGLKQEHIKAFENLWKLSEVVIEGDNEAMESLNYSLYHLHSIAPRHTNSLSIAARGLSGQTYKGAVFWDTEMFMLDFFLYTEPDVAKTLLKYRVDTLDGAKSKAKSYGFVGAFYPWESQEGGYDACSDYNVIDVFTKRPMRTFFKDKQIHISSAVVYGIMSYTEFTGDRSLLEEGGIEVIVECARFYYDLLLKKVSSEYYELHDVVGPDEYHERVNNNGYTNRMAKFTFDSAAQLLRKLSEYPEALVSELTKKYQVQSLIESFERASARLYLPKPHEETKVIEQFDGYYKLEDASLMEVKSRILDDREYWGGAYGVASHTKIIKQADVVTWLTLFPEDFDRDTLLKNWDYYETRTEHGSSLSACMYALLACKLDKPEIAYPFFLKSAAADLSIKGKEWAGLVYIGGTHPASAGGAYMNAVKGFAGLKAEGSQLTLRPALPHKWTKMKFHIVFQGTIYEANITKTHHELREIGKYN